MTESDPQAVTRSAGSPHAWRDGVFWLAVLAAPLCWGLMILAGVSVRTGIPAWKTMLIVLLVSPVLEEIVFRGGLQGLLLERKPLSRTFAGISMANVITSFAFAAMHLVSQPPLWAALIFIPSLVFGWARERHATLLSPIALHIFYNAGFIVLFQ